MSRKLPDTSKAAYESVKPELIPNHHAKILEAFDKVESATYEEAADLCGLDRIAVGRRISELIKEGKLYRTDLKRKTSTQRDAYLIAKVDAGLPKAEEKTKIAKPKPTSKIQVTDENKVVVTSYVRRKRIIETPSQVKMEKLF